MRDEGDEEEGVGSSLSRFSACSAGLKAQVPSGFSLGSMRAAIALASSSPSPSASQYTGQGRGGSTVGPHRRRNETLNPFRSKGAGRRIVTPTKPPSLPVSGDNIDCCRLLLRRGRDFTASAAGEIRPRSPPSSDSPL